MKRFTLLAAAGLFSMSLSAQEAKEYGMIDEVLSRKPAL